MLGLCNIPFLQNRVVYILRLLCYTTCYAVCFYMSRKVKRASGAGKTCTCYNISNNTNDFGLLTVQIIQDEYKRRKNVQYLVQ